MSTEQPVRVAIYARQSVTEAEGIAAQVETCRAEVKRRGWVEVGTYEDNATSASKDRGAGTGWARMLSDVDTGKVDVVVVVAVDRLMRRLSDVLEVRPPKRDLRVVVVRGGIDTGDQFGGFILSLFVLVAENEIHTKRARALPYAARRRAAGHPWPGMTPFGYAWVPDSQRDAKETRWAVVDEEAAVVRRVHREFSKGATLASIARGLNDEGLRTRTGARWGTPTLRRILLSPFYVGLLPPRQGWAAFRAEDVVLSECTPGIWKPIVTRKVYDANRSRLLDPSRKTQTGTARKWLLGGLARCSVCVQPVRSAKTPEGFQGYRCRDGHFHRRAEMIDAYVVSEVLWRLGQPDARTFLRAPRTGPTVAELAGSIGALDERERFLSQAVADGRLSPQNADDALSSIERERAALEAQRADALRADPLAEMLDGTDVGEVWEGLSLARRREVIDALVSIEILPVGKGKRATTLEEVEPTLRVRFRDYAPVIVALEPGHDDELEDLNRRMGFPAPLSEEAAAMVAGATVPVE